MFPFRYGHRNSGEPATPSGFDLTCLPGAHPGGGCGGGGPVLGCGSRPLFTYVHTQPAPAGTVVWDRVLVLIVDASIRSLLVVLVEGLKDKPSAY